MADWFEDLTKSFADNTTDTLSRRHAVRNIAGAIVGITLATWLPGKALAQDKFRHMCKDPGTCSTPFYNCDLNRYHNTNCYCFQQAGTGKGVCGCNSYCECAPPPPPCQCNSQADCSTGYFCISNTGCGCGYGICVQKCNSTCVLSPNHSGRTAAGV